MPLPKDWKDPNRRGMCPFMQDPDAGIDCLTRPCWSGPPPVCLFYDMKGARGCAVYYRMAELANLWPELWTDQVCCEEWRIVALQCAEASGYLAGALDIFKHPNDGKTVWRNFQRRRFRFCPFCGARLVPSPEELDERRTHGG